MATSPLKLERQLVQSPEFPSEEEPLSSSWSKFSAPTNSEESFTGTSGEQNDMSAMELKTVQKLNMKLISKDPMYYLGLPQASYGLIDTLAECLQTDSMNILICLKKIRLNASFQGLSYDFSVSKSYCSKTFKNLLPDLAACFSSLIQWPVEKEIKRRLPIPFRARFSHVQSIIDCFEIEIEKPTDAIKQTLTWSNYKKCNTIKYLISCTPDGYINFVSQGFGGRTSDTKLTELSGYLYVLPDGASVMADRGFKGLAPSLEKKGCQLIRPPSVAADHKSSMKEVRLSKKIASLRINIERVIRRVREFSFLRPHSCVDHNLVKYLDVIVQMVCGLVNLQKPLIKNYT